MSEANFLRYFTDYKYFHILITKDVKALIGTFESY